MYIREFHIKNFRNLEEINLKFHKGLNVLVGENNSGKTSIFDALRICLGFGDRYRNVYINKSDFFIDKEQPDYELPKIEFDLFFEIEEDEELGIFRELLVPKGDGEVELQLHHEYYFENVNGIEKLRYQVWGGENKGQQIDPEVLDLIRHIYLGALRNASKELRPVRGNKLGELFSKLNKDIQGRVIDEDKRDEMASKIRDSIHEDDEWNDLIETGLKEINEHLEKISIRNNEQVVNIDFLPFEFDRLVDYLRIQLPIFKNSLLDDESDQEYFDISQNGLGYNNLIFTATVLGNLSVITQVDPATYIALIIEEPEAHLHPQLQNIFFKYLNDLNNKGFQLFISSHSPTLTAKAKLNSLILLQNKDGNVDSLAINDLNLSDENLKYLAKFLDVTESQLFFAKGVLLVEGISETLLMQIFSVMISENDEYNLEKNGVEIVNIGGISFKHFAGLYNSENQNNRLANKCCIITDSDPDQETGEISDRAKKAKELEGGNLEVKLAENTFEYDLFIECEENRRILLECFNQLHPIAADRIKEGSSDQDYAKSFLEKVESNNAKSRLAHSLAIKLANNTEDQEKFQVPNYISEAITELFE
mgnify:CR=1 FL=1